MSDRVKPIFWIVLAEGREVIINVNHIVVLEQGKLTLINCSYDLDDREYELIKNTLFMGYTVL